MTSDGKGQIFIGSTLYTSRYPGQLRCIKSLSAILGTGSKNMFDSSSRHKKSRPKGHEEELQRRLRPDCMRRVLRLTP